jgi:hypothetical protein
MNNLDEAMNEYLKRNPPGSREERKRMRKLAGINESTPSHKVKEAVDAFKQAIEQIKTNLDGRRK